MNNNIIKEYKILSESPSDHWPFLEVQGKRVLDCGCGRWDAKNKEEYTPVYFLEKGADYVVGVDISLEEIRYYQEQNIPNSIFIADSLNTSKKLVSLINDYKIQAIKMDIEGWEKIIFDTSSDDFSNISQIAIEYHMGVSKDNLLCKLVELGFREFIIGYLWIDGMGVIFAKRCNN